MKRIISLLMIALMLVTSVPYGGLTAGAADADTENYNLTFEASLADSFMAESSAEGAVSFFGSAEFDGCYGNQLSDVARELYDSLVKSYAADKTTGEYTYAFDTPFTFNAEVSDGSIISNDELEEIKLELHYAMQAAMDAFLYDHPEVFWLKLLGSSCSISASGNEVIGYTGIIDEITIIPTEIYDGAASKLSQYASAVEAALDNITVTESRYDTLKNVHDYICEKAWYNPVSEQRVHSSEPFFIGDGGVVCEGYAKAFKVLCDRLEIPCVLVSGDAGGAHMWNYVQMDDGKWYLVDATWDDQNSQIFDTYFLANAYTIGFNGVAISAERTERTDFSGTGIFSFTYPVLSATAYTVHVHEWESEYTVDFEPTCTEKGSKSIHCRTCDETKSVTEVPALTHRWNEGIINPVSTCKTHGIKTYTCQNDTSHIKTEQLALDGNNHEGGTYLKDKAEATCTENGYTGDTYCLGCNKKLEAGETISAKAHIFTDYISDGNATCIADGTKTAICDVCKIAKDTVADEDSKNNAEHKYSVRAGCSATCTQEGERLYVCDVCEIATYTEIIPATGKHSFIACMGEDSTCTEDGFIEYCCEICETETYRETLPAKGHKGGTATCKSKAKCTVCGEEYGSVNVNNHKSLVTFKAVSSTCTKTGLTEGKKCNDCGKITLAQKTVAKKAHTNKTTTTKATLKKNGKAVTKCTVCGAVAKTTTICYPKTVKLSATSYTYNGKTKTPSVTVKDSKGKNLKKGTDYTVTYPKKRTSIGKYTVTVTFKGNYSGTKKLSFEIVPAKTALSKVTAGKKQLTATWKTVSGVTGYEVQYSTSKKFTKKTTKTVTIKKAKTKKTTIKKLTKGKKYYVKLRAYRTVSGKKLYGAWSSVKNVKVK